MLIDRYFLLSPHPLKKSLTFQYLSPSLPLGFRRTRSRKPGLTARTVSYGRPFFIVNDIVRDLSLSLQEVRDRNVTLVRNLGAIHWAGYDLPPDEKLVDGMPGPLNIKQFNRASISFHRSSFHQVMDPVSFQRKSW